LGQYINFAVKPYFDSEITSFVVSCPHSSFFRWTFGPTKIWQNQSIEPFAKGLRPPLVEARGRTGTGRTTQHINFSSFLACERTGLIDLKPEEVVIFLGEGKWKRSWSRHDECQADYNRRIFKMACVVQVLRLQGPIVPSNRKLLSSDDSVWLMFWGFLISLVGISHLNNEHLVCFTQYQNNSDIGRSGMATISQTSTAYPYTRRERLGSE